MKERRPRWSMAEEARLWDEWRRGTALVAVSALVGHSLVSVWDHVARRGGIAPPPRRRARRTLQLAEREAISRGLSAGTSVRALARQLGRAPSTISREIRRHGGRQRYRATRADARAWARARRPKRCRLATSPRLRRVVTAKLEADWSPEQIAAWLRRTFPDEPAMQLSHETIYRTLYVQARGALKRSLLAHLRQRHSLRRSRAAATRPTRRPGQLRDMVSIAERPPAADTRAVPGHWEGDLLLGRPGSQIATLVERQSRFVVLLRVPAADSATVVHALVQRVQRLPVVLKQSLTWDQGKEMAQHARFTVATDVQVYFCDPQSPWQRGSNENTNGLLRQYFPKGTDLRPVTQSQLDAVARKLNTRPRRTLDWQTPAEVYNHTVASIG